MPKRTSTAGSNSRNLASAAPTGVFLRPRSPLDRWIGTLSLCLPVALISLIVLIVGCVDRPGDSTSGESGPDVPGQARSTASSSGAPSGDPIQLFTDITEEAGIRFDHVCGARGEYLLPEGIGPGGAFLDYDDDGDIDLYLVQSGEFGETDELHANRLYRNDGKGRFTDVTEAAGAGVAGASLSGYGIGCSAADYDNDGDVDLFLTRLGPNVLLRNNGDGTFSDITAQTGLGDPGFGASAAFFDYDRDGHLDLFVVNYVDWAPGREGACFSPTGLRDYCGPTAYEAPSRDRLYHATGDGRFTDVTERAGIGDVKGNGLGVICTDVDDDGWLDIYVANDQTPAFLWINQQDGTFREEATLRGCGFNSDGIAIAGMGVVAEDLDGDNDIDLVVTNIHDQAHLCLRNEGGYFRDTSHSSGFGGWGVPYTGFGIALFDQDHDGVLDGLVANGAVNRLSEPFRPDNPYAEPNQFIRRDSTGKFFDASDEAGSPIRAYEMSRGLLLGDIDNDGDLDAVVTNNRGPTQVLRNDSLTVRWPSGTVDSWLDLPVNQLFELREGSTATKTEIGTRLAKTTATAPGRG